MTATEAALKRWRDNAAGMIHCDPEVRVVLLELADLIALVLEKQTQMGGGYQRLG